MIIPDINLLVFAYNQGAREHDAARQRWQDLIGGRERIGVPWVVSTGFVRVLTHPRAVTPTVNPADAVDRVNDWFQFANVSPINPGSDHLIHFRRNLLSAGVGGNLTIDAHIAAIAMEHQAVVH